jgi:hypothetical protein
MKDPSPGNFEWNFPLYSIKKSPLLKDFFANTPLPARNSKIDEIISKCIISISF